MTENEKAATFIGWKPNQTLATAQFPQSVLLNGSQAEAISVAMPEPDMTDPRHWASALGYALTVADWEGLSPELYSAIKERNWRAIVKLLANLYDAKEERR